jgi:hypothetical protein
MEAGEEEMSEVAPKSFVPSACPHAAIRHY